MQGGHNSEAGHGYRSYDSNPAEDRARQVKGTGIFAPAEEVPVPGHPKFEDWGSEEAWDRAQQEATQVIQTLTSTEDSPSEPVGAELQKYARGEATGEHYPLLDSVQQEKQGFPALNITGEFLTLKNIPLKYASWILIGLGTFIGSFLTLLLVVALEIVKG